MTCLRVAPLFPLLIAALATMIELVDINEATFKRYFVSLLDG